MLRAVCPECRRRAFVVEGRMQCCGLWVGSVEPTRIVRETEAAHRRKHLSVGTKEAVLRTQRFRCFYCGESFGRVVQLPTGKVTQLRVHFDHMVPFAYDQNNHPYNFVAACHLCNGMKSDLVFETVQAVRDYLVMQWRAKRYVLREEQAQYIAVSGVRFDVHAASPMAEVLPSEVPVYRVGSPKP